MSCLEESGTAYERFVNYFDGSVLKRLGKELLPDEMAEGHEGILFELTESQARYLKRFIDFSHDESYPHTSSEKELLLGFFLNKLFDFCDAEKITRVGTAAFYIQDVLRYIAENISDLPDVDGIARHFAVSRSKLDRDFKTGVGMTVHDFSELCRLNYAKGLLMSEKNHTVSDISEACGFKNETYFFAFFKKHTGVSPSEYRKGKAKIAEVSIDETDFNPCGGNIY
jgi:AraC-like DNA-binding protein